MNNPITTSGTYQPNSSYTVLRSKREESVSYGPIHEPSYSWQKFLHSSASQAESETAITVVVAPVERTTAEGPTVPAPKPLSDDHEAKIEAFLHFLDSLDSEAETIDEITSEQ